jgi:GNAT superfamily N-acetyltransferase
MSHSVEAWQIPNDEQRNEFVRSLGDIVTQYQEELGMEFVHDPTTHLYVAREPDAPAVGLANVLPCGPREYEIAGRIVDQAYRGQGIGSSMSRFILNHLRETSARTVWTNPIDDVRVTEPAERLGFREASRNGMPAMRYDF